MRRTWQLGAAAALVCSALLTAPLPAHAASTVAMPTIHPRAEWGADESLRPRNADGSLTQPPQFEPLQKIIVHHSAADPAPGQTPQQVLQNIYYGDIHDRGFVDFSYTYAIDWNGGIWEGRANAAPGQPAPGPPGMDASGNVVVGAHALSFNAGTVGLVLLGNLDVHPAPPAQYQALVALVAWLAASHGLDPHGVSLYTNPITPSVTATLPNILGHRDVTATDCPGNLFYPLLPQLRDDVAATIAAAQAAVPTLTFSSPTVSVGTSRTVSDTLTVGWPAGATGSLDGLTTPGIAGVGVALTPAPPTAGPVALSLHVPLTVRPGRYPLSVTATSGSASATAQVTLTVPPPCRVPRVIGRTLTAAQRALRAGHCRSNVVRRVRSITPAGRVLRQFAPAGALRVPGFAVALSVSRGTR
jgi:hypothetical protein